MPSRPLYDPDWEPYDQAIRLRFTLSQVDEFSRVARRYGVSRALLLRLAVARGLQPAVADLEARARAGMAAGGRKRPVVRRVLRGPSGGPVADVPFRRR